MGSESVRSELIEATDLLRAAWERCEKASRMAAQPGSDSPIPQPPHDLRNLCLQIDEAIRSSTACRAALHRAA